MNLDCVCGAPAAYVLLPSRLLACAACLEHARPYFTPDVLRAVPLEDALRVADALLADVHVLLQIAALTGPEWGVTPATS